MTTSNEPQNSRRWLILVLVSIAQLMVVLDTTVVNIALPSAQHALGFSDANRQWIVTGYALAFGSLLLLGGRISDLFGRKWTLTIAPLGFAAASALGGAAQSFEMLVSARVLQGVFGAILAPAALSLLTTTFSQGRERAKAFGVYGAIGGGGAAIGLILGGVLTEYLSWRWCLYVNLALALPVALGAVALITNDVATQRPRLDMPGTLTASGGLFALVYGLAKADTDGWGAPITLAFLGVAAALLVAFVLIERRASHPLLPLRVVADRGRGGSYLAVGMAAIGMFGVFLFLTYYLQQTLGYTPVRNGLAFVPMTAVIVVTATLATSRLVPRLGPRPLVSVGMLLSAGGMVMLTGLGLHSSYAGDVLPALLVLGAGLGLVFAPAMNGATARVAASDSGVASAMVNTAQQVGGSIGTALLNTLFASAVAAAASGAARTPAAMAQATMHGYTTIFWWSAGIFVAGAVLTWLLLPRGRPQPAAEPAAEAAPVRAH